MKKKEKTVQKYLEKRNKLRDRNQLYDVLKDLSEKVLNKSELKSKECDNEKKLKNKNVRVRKVKTSKPVFVFNKDECSLHKSFSFNDECRKYESGKDNDSGLLTNATIADLHACNYDEMEESVCERPVVNPVKLRFVGSQSRSAEIEDYRKQMPVYYMQSEIVEAVKSSLITFVQGDTGSGKSTQIPQFLYEAGFGELGIIGVTQPRRISAISISNRINEEFNEEISGYKIKNENTVKESSRIKVMTDGILLAEMCSDFLLSNYSVVILDEVHERSTNIDVLIVLLSRVVSFREKPLRVILMSATSSLAYFENHLGPFKSVVVTPNTHKVSVFYNNFVEDYMSRYVELAFDKIMKILLCEVTSLEEGNTNNVANNSSASILVFLASKRDIYLLKSKIEEANWNVTIIPLHSSLSKRACSSVYAKTHNRKVILSTNISETGLTIPDVSFVIDTGLVKRKFTNERGVVLYKTGFISKSSAKQRCGRAGRTKPGACFRLYSGMHYENFADDEMPKILTESSEDVLLKLLGLGISNVYTFPFLTPPPNTYVKEALETLEFLGALSKGRITETGMRMIKYPLSSRLSRLLCSQNVEEVFTEMTVLSSILSSSFELKRNEKTDKYFLQANSDYLVMLRIFSDYLLSNDKQDFCRTVGFSYSLFDDILKTTRHLLKISGKASEVTSLDLGMEKFEKLCRIVHSVFSDHIAISNGNSMFFNSEEVYLSNDSIDITGCNVVFGYLSVSKNKKYMKNITLINL